MLHLFAGIERITSLVEFSEEAGAHGRLPAHPEGSGALTVGSSLALSLSPGAVLCQARVGILGPARGQVLEDGGVDHPVLGAESWVTASATTETAG